MQEISKGTGELSAFVASLLLGGAEREPMTAETAFIAITNWIRDGVELPAGMTAAALADEWNRQLAADAAGAGAVDKGLHLPYNQRRGGETMPTNRSISQMRFDKENTRRYGIKLNTHTDADIIARLDAQPSMQGYIRKLIRDDIAREQGVQDARGN